MKKIISVIMIITVVFLLCSCKNTQTYIKQDNINLNYNNISAGSGCWLNNNFICLIKHNFGFDLSIVDDKSKKIDTLSYSYEAHLYNDKLYYFDTAGLNSTKYKFIEYDLNTQKKRNLATITAERVYDYYVANEYLYIVVGKNDSLIKDVVSIALDTSKQNTIEQNIFACGIVNGELNYITKEDLKYSVYKYNTDNQKSELIGDFELNNKIYNDILLGVNFTSEYIAFAYCDNEITKSKIYVYQYDNTLNEYDFNGTIIEFIAYDKFAFFSADGDVYRFDFDNKSAEKIAELSVDDISLFVGSDNEVYVASMDFNGIRRYSIDGKYEDVLFNQEN